MPAKKKATKKAAPKKAEKKVEERVSATVFYNELSPNGERTGSVANKVFSTRKEAEKFAEEVKGRIL